MSSEPSRQHTPSPFPAPSGCAAALALPPDDDWVVTGTRRWVTSRAPSPARLPTPVPTPPITFQLFQQFQQWQAMSMQQSAATAGALHPLPDSSSRPSTPLEGPKRKIPRPPNAFMLYRSHLLKTGKIPKEFEHRQQNISRVAGECWNMLSMDEKAVWHAEARNALELHKLRHPDYKFAPERKSSRRKIAPHPDAPEPNSEEYIRYIREHFVGINGPARTPPRPRKPRSRRGAEARSQTPISLPPSLHPSPTATPTQERTASAPPSFPAGPSRRGTPMPQHLPPVSVYDVPHELAMLSMPPPPPGYFHHSYFTPYPLDIPATPLGDGATPRSPAFGLMSPHKYAYSPLLSMPGPPGDGHELELGLGVHLSPLAGPAPRGASCAPSEEPDSSPPPPSISANEWESIFGSDLPGCVSSMLEMRGPDPSLTYDHTVEYDQETIFPPTD